MKCPKCNSELVIKSYKSIEVEYCNKCRGVWVDFDELNRLDEVLALLPIELEWPIGQRHMLKEDELLLAQLYESVDQFNTDRPIKKLRIKNELLGGFGGAHILVVVPVERDGTPDGKNQTPRVVKIGPRSMLEAERNNYSVFVKQFLVTAVAQQTRFAVRGTRAAIEYIFVGGGMLEPVSDLNSYYKKHTANEIVEVINALVLHLGEYWYSKPSELGEHTYVEYAGNLPPSLELKIRDESDDCVWVQGDIEPPSSVEYNSCDLNEISASKKLEANKTAVKIHELRVVRVKPWAATLESTEAKHIKVRLVYNRDSRMDEKLQISQCINVRGQVISTRDDFLETIVKTAFNCSVEDAVASLNKDIYPNPLKLYSDLLNTWLVGYRTTIHGDLHPRNILVDSHQLPWLIDFGRVREGHTLFDFIKLETYIRLDIVSDAPDLTSVDYITFEEKLAKAMWHEDSINTFRPKTVLHKAFHVISAIREMARRFHPLVEISFSVTYSRCLMLYNLSVLKYARGAAYNEVGEQERERQLRFARHCFITSAVQARWLENPPMRKLPKIR